MKWKQFRQATRKQICTHVCIYKGALSCHASRHEVFKLLQRDIVDWFDECVCWGCSLGSLLLFACLFSCFLVYLNFWRVWIPLFITSKAHWLFSLKFAVDSWTHALVLMMFWDKFLKDFHFWSFVIPSEYNFHSGLISSQTWIKSSGN